jgi:hypothetical protein
VAGASAGVPLGGADAAHAVAGSLARGADAPFGLLPEAWESGVLDWHPELDEERAAAFPDKAALVDWADAIAQRWAGFVALEEPSLDRRDFRLTSPRGDLEWVPLIVTQRIHAAFHYRQLQAFADLEGLARPRGTLELSALSDLVLAAEVF